MTIRVLLADDHRMLRETLRMLLESEPDIKVVGEAIDGRAVLELATQLKPDVVVMDIGMPGMTGIEATRRLLAQQPEIKVVALSCYAQKQYVLEMLEAGACGYILKEDASDELLRALRAVMKGHKYLCPAVAEVIVEDVADHADHYFEPGRPQLCPRERQVLQLLAEGDTSPRIALRLFISASTVDVHRRNIMRKLNLHSVAELTKYAIRNGLTPG